MQQTLKTRSLWLFIAAAFMLAALMPGFALRGVEHGAARYLPAVFGEKILICTGSSFKWVKLADVQSGKEKPKSHSPEKCQLCQGAFSGFTPAEATTAVSARALLFAPVITYRAFLTFLSLASPLNMRAPPVSL